MGRGPDQLTGDRASPDVEPFVRDGDWVFPPGWSNCAADDLVDDVIDEALPDGPLLENDDDGMRALAQFEIAHTPPDGHEHTVRVVEVGEGDGKMTGVLTDRLPDVPHRVLAVIHVAPDGARRVRWRSPRAGEVRRSVGVRHPTGVRRPQCTRRRRPARRVVKAGGPPGDSDGSEPEPGPARRRTLRLSLLAADVRVRP